MNVMVAVDLSDLTASLMAAVHDLPALQGTKLYLVHVAEPDPSFVGWEAGPEVVREQVAGEFRREHQELARLADALRGEGRDVTALLVQGPTVDTLLRQASKLKAGLLVVGSHGHGAAFDLVIGSVSAGVIRKSPVPVLVIPGRSAGPAGDSA